MSTSSTVPAFVLNHGAFISALKTCPIGPELLYDDFLSQAHGSQERVKDLLDHYFENRQGIPKIGVGQGPTRQYLFDHGIKVTLTYIAINSLPQYLVEMVVKPDHHEVFAAPWEIHGRLGDTSEDRLGAVNGVYYMAINQGFCIRTPAGQTPYFAIPELD